LEETFLLYIVKLIEVLECKARGKQALLPCRFGFQANEALIFTASGAAFALSNRRWTQSAAQDHS